MTIRQAEIKVTQATAPIVSGGARADIVPTRFDVICGRDKQSVRHEGNKQFRTIVEQYRVRYQRTSVREEKTRITCEIISRIRAGSMHKPGGRFLKLDPDTKKWCDAGDEFAREKVSHALRSAKDPNREKHRKKRKVVTKNATQDENCKLEQLLLEQLRTFQRLVAERTAVQQANDARDSAESEPTPTTVCSMYTSPDVVESG